MVSSIIIIIIIIIIIVIIMVNISEKAVAIRRTLIIVNIIFIPAIMIIMFLHTRFRWREDPRAMTQLQVSFERRKWQGMVVVKLIFP